MKDSEFIALAYNTAKGILAGEVGKLIPKHQLKFSELLKNEIDLLILLSQVDVIKAKKKEEETQDEHSPQNVL